jgi:hypothetical protein
MVRVHYVDDWSRISRSAITLACDCHPEHRIEFEVDLSMLATGEKGFMIRARHEAVREMAPPQVSHLSAKRCMMHAFETRRR